MKRLLELYQKILEITRQQKKALLQGRLHEATELQKRRQSIVEEIQNIDMTMSFAPSKRENDSRKEDFSREIQAAIKEILAIDSEMKTIIQVELNSLGERLESLNKVKALCRNVSPGKGATSLDLSV
jgi:predicted membrane chloride channel (bestrophin family)